MCGTETYTNYRSQKQLVCALWKPLSVGCAVAMGVFIVATGLPSPMKETTLHVPFKTPLLLRLHSFRLVNLCVCVLNLYLTPLHLSNQKSEEAHEGGFPTNKSLLRKAPQSKHSTWDPFSHLQTESLQLKRGQRKLRLWRKKAHRNNQQRETQYNHKVSFSPETSGISTGRIRAL